MAFQSIASSINWLRRWTFQHPQPNSSITKLTSQMASPNGPDYNDTTDFANAKAGRIATLDPCIIHNEDGKEVWNNDAFAFLEDPCPTDTANRSLWRQGQLCFEQGLFKVTENIYPVRGLDISNMSLIESSKGVVVIDPLVSKERAEAAMLLYRKNVEGVENRPWAGLIFTHPHTDHFCGALGVLPKDFSDVQSTLQRAS